jgi:hypothetical protein
MGNGKRELKLYPLSRIRVEIVKVSEDQAEVMQFLKAAAAKTTNLMWTGLGCALCDTQLGAGMKMGKPYSNYTKALNMPNFLNLLVETNIANVLS